MARKVKKSNKVRKQEKKEKEKRLKEAWEIGSQNFSYYMLIRNIRAFVEMAVQYFGINVITLREGKVDDRMIDFCKKEWVDIIKRCGNFLVKKYPHGKGDNIDFVIMDETMIGEGATMMKKLHKKDLILAYGENFKSKYPEVEKTMDFLGEVIARFNSIQESVNREDLIMKRNEKQTVKTIVTRFNKYLRPSIMEIIKGE